LSGPPEQNALVGLVDQLWGCFFNTAAQRRVPRRTSQSWAAGATVVRR